MLTYPCGHPRTPENTQRVGVSNGVRCRECRRKITREWARRQAEAKRAVVCEAAS